MARDFQRKKVYASEWELRQVCKGQPVSHRSMSMSLMPEKKFRNLKAVQKYVDKLDAAPYTYRYAKVPCRVEERRKRGLDSSSYAHYERGNLMGHIYLPVPGMPNGWALRELVVLHEYAHHMSSSEKYAGHGPEFCQRFLLLLEKQMGLPYRNFMIEQYIKNKVKF